MNIFFGSWILITPSGGQLLAFLLNFILCSSLMVGWLGTEDRVCGVPHVVHRMWYTARTPAQCYYVNLVFLL